MRHNSLSQNDVRKKLKEKGLILISKYESSHKKIKVRCIQCKGEYSNKAYVAWKTTCTLPVCYKARIKLKKRNTALKKHGSLLKHPYLVKEYSKNNLLKPEEVPCNFRELVEWICSKCGHKWSAPPRIRLINYIKDQKYRLCTGKCKAELMRKIVTLSGVKRSGNLKELYPNLMKEWDYELNTIDPSKVSPKSNKIANWKCKFGHQWSTSIYNRTKINPTNCPDCNNFQTSKAEIRIFSEIKKLINNTIWSHRYKKIQIDIFLPSLKIAIEIDGFYHIGNEKRDREKNRFLSKNGITTIRLRDKKCKSKISSQDFFVETSEIKIFDIKKICKYLLLLKDLKKIERQKLKEYLKKTNFINNSEYKKIVSFLPSPPIEKSLKKTHPNLCNEWDYKKNEPLKPEYFTHGSQSKVWWICAKCHKSYQMQIQKRTQKKPQGCKICGNKIAKLIRDQLYLKKNGSLKEKFPDIAKQFMSKKNGISPSKVQSKSSIYFWWYCKIHNYEWMAPVDERTVRKTGCKFCGNIKMWETRRKNTHTQKS